MLGFAASDATLSPDVPPPAPPAVVQGLGYAAGFSSGIGFHYRMFTEDLGFGVTGLTLYRFQDGSGGLSVGAEVLKNIFLLDWGRFYGVGAVHHTRSFSATSLTSNTFAGPGLGIAFGPTKGVNVAVEVPYTFSIGSGGSLDWALPVPNLILYYQY
jgi:hypothetical protein